MYGEYDFWSITVFDANFMLSQYNGRGNTITPIVITPFPNMGDGLYGYVQFSINNNPCFSSSITNIEGESSSFNVFPKYVTLNGNGDSEFITVDSNCEWTISPTSTDDFSTTKADKYDATSRLADGFTITSKSDVSFENQEIVVKNNCNELTEIVYVSQKPSQTTSNMLSVNPQYIALEGNNKTFSVNVISVCNGSNDYNYTSLNGVNIVKNGNAINGNITSDTFESGTFKVSNACDEKEVTVIYNKTSESECSILIDGETSVSYEFTADTTASFSVESSSNWGVYSYDSSKVRCSKNGNTLKVSLGEDKSKTENKEIILRNREGCEARVIYSVASGLISESGITFTFESGATEMATALTQDSSSDDITFDVCVFAYDNNKNAIEWRVKSSAFNATTTELSGGVDECKSVTLKATDSTKKSKNTSYIVKLQEQETYKELTIKLTITRPQDEVTSSYDVDIYPESGIYSRSEMNDFQISVTPTYVYNGNNYYIGDNNIMENGNTSYKGVTADTVSNTNGVTLELTNGDDVYDTLIYNVNIDSSTLDSFEICTKATSKDGSLQSNEKCTTITLTAATYEVSCDFTTGSTTIEVGGEAQTIDEIFYSQINGEKADISVVGKPDWIESIRLDEYGEKLYIKLTENDSYNERIASGITITQDGGECDGEYVITIKQYGNKTIFIPDFDYLVIRYIWTAEDGVDLDTVTVVSSLMKKDGSSIENSDKYTSFLNQELGWSHSSGITDANSNVLLDFAGDNINSGTECVYINFKNICSEEQLTSMINDDVNKIHVDLYGNWFGSRIDGNLDVELVAYKGGTMSEPVNFNFTNSGGEEVYNSVKSTRVCAQGRGSDNAAAYEVTYTKIGYVEYNITNGNAMLLLNDAECDESAYILLNTMGSTSITIPYSASSENYVTFSSSKNGVVFNNLTLTSSQYWLTNLTTTSTSNPFKYNFTVTENSGETDRYAKITVVQGESNKQIDYQIVQKSKCGCSSPETVNATATISVKTQANGSKLYESNGSYYIDVICNVVLDKTIMCGTATARIEYSLGSIGNAGFSDVEIPNGASSGTSTIAYSCGLIDDYDENKPMDCISSDRTSHSLTFTKNNCYVKGIITATVDSNSLCQPCTCDVTSITVSPTSYKYTYDGEEKIFTLKVETDTCDLCTKGYKLYNPNGSLVTAGTGENTVIITYATAVKGDYTLIADDDNTKTATLSIDKFNAYYVFCIRQTETYVDCYSSTTITYSADSNPSELYNITIRSRYYTSDTEYTQINFSMTTDVNWITLNDDRSFKVSANNTYSERQGTITYTQEITGNKVYCIVKQYGITLTNNCGNLVVDGRNWELTLPYAAASDVTFTFNAVNSFGQGGTTYSDWTQAINVKSGSKIGTAQSSTTQFTKNVTFDHASPSADTKYIYCSNNITASTGETTGCTCSVTSISVSPTSHTFENTVPKTFTVTVNDNDCSGCTGGWLLYQDYNNIYITSGTTSTFTMSSDSDGTYTLKAKDDTSKIANFVLTRYTAPATCTTHNTWSSISVSNVSAGKCDTSASMTVTANGTHTDNNCRISTTSATLSSSDYSVRYGTSNGNYTLTAITANETTSTKTWYYQVTASSTYGSKTYSGSFTQDSGKCTPDTGTTGATFKFSVYQANNSRCTVTHDIRAIFHDSKGIEIQSGEMAIGGTVSVLVNILGGIMDCDTLALVVEARDSGGRVIKSRMLDRVREYEIFVVGTNWTFDTSWYHEINIVYYVP